MCLGRADIKLAVRRLIITYDLYSLNYVLELLEIGTCNQFKLTMHETALLIAVKRGIDKSCQFKRLHNV